MHPAAARQQWPLDKPRLRAMLHAWAASSSASIAALPVQCGLPTTSSAESCPLRPFDASQGLHATASVEVGDNMIASEPIVITDLDLQRLLPMLERHAADGDALDWELHRATIVSHDAVPADIVTMNSDVVYEDCETGARRTVRVVYPEDADASRGHISVLAPIGSALLGLKVGQMIQWVLPTGVRSVFVVEIRYQPEANGDFHL
jgi:regulator of nucleoside diphosphate kinase